MTIEKASISLQIITALCAGQKPKDIQASLGLTASVFESRFEGLREAACLPKEKRAYVACADLVMGNLERLEEFNTAQDAAASVFKASLYQFNY